MIYENSRGGNYWITADANLPNPFGQTFRENAKEDRQRKFWQSTQHPEGIFTEKFYRQKFNYIHLNPVRKGLVRSAVDWRFSSAEYWLDNHNAGHVPYGDDDKTSVEPNIETSVEHEHGVGCGSPDLRREYPRPRRIPNDVELSAIGWE